METLFMVTGVLSLIALIVLMVNDVITKKTTKVISKKTIVFTLVFFFSVLSFITLFTAESSASLLTIYWLLFAVITLSLFIANMKLKKKMKLLGATEYLNATHADGLPISKGIQTNLFCCPDKLIIESKEGRFEVPTERINNYARLTAREILEENKNVIGRAVVGGILLGGLGAIVGGMSGVGTKKTNINKVYFVVNYENKDGETVAISFETKQNVKSFVKKFSEATGRPIFDNKQLISL